MLLKTHLPDTSPDMFGGIPKYKGKITIRLAAGDHRPYHWVNDLSEKVFGSDKDRWLDLCLIEEAAEIIDAHLIEMPFGSDMSRCPLCRASSRNLTTINNDDHYMRVNRQIGHGLKLYHCVCKNQRCGHEFGVYRKESGPFREFRDGEIYVRPSSLLASDDVASVWF